MPGKTHLGIQVTGKHSNNSTFITADTVLCKATNGAVALCLHILCGHSKNCGDFLSVPGYGVDKVPCHDCSVSLRRFDDGDIFLSERYVNTANL